MWCCRDRGWMCQKFPLCVLNCWEFQLGGVKNQSSAYGYLFFSTKYISYFYKVKGITCRICLLLFVNATFKVGCSSLAQSARTSGGPTCLRSGNWSLHFYRVPHLTTCALLLAGGYTPLPKG